MWSDYDLEVRRDPTIPYDLRLEVRYSPESRRSELNRLTAVQRLGMVEVNGTGLRTIRIQDYLATAGVEVSLLLDPLPRRGHVEYPSKKADDALRTVQQQVGESPELVFLVYRLGELANLPPVREVERVLGLQPRTATRRIQSARAQGAFAVAESYEEVADRDLLPTTKRVLLEDLHG